MSLCGISRIFIFSFYARLSRKKVWKLWRIRKMWINESPGSLCAEITRLCGSERGSAGLADSFFLSKEGLEGSKELKSFAESHRNPYVEEVVREPIPQRRDRLVDPGMQAPGICKRETDALFLFFFVLQPLAHGFSLFLFSSSCSDFFSFFSLNHFWL